MTGCGCKISAIEYYLPEALLTNQELESRFPDFKAEKIEKKIGVVQRHIAAKTETALDMAEKACKKLFEQNDSSSIDFLLFCTQSSDYNLPTTACVLQDRLNLNRNIGALDFNLGCSGFIYGLALAKSMIFSGMAQNILLVTSETYSKHISPEDKGNLSIFGDAAAATLIQAAPNDQIHEFCFGTDGSGYKNLIVPNGGMRNPKDRSKSDFLYMDGPAIFNFTLEVLPGLVENTLRVNKTSLEKLDYFIFHQANQYMLKTLRQIINIPEDRFYINLTTTGNTVSASIPIAIKQAQDMGRIKSNDKIMLAGFGVGYSYGATIITF